jgi:gluconolactonase
MTRTALTGGKPLLPLDAVTLIWQGVDHPEGVAVDVDGTIWCGGEDGQVYRGHRDEDPVQVAELPGRTLGFALDAEGNAYCADMSGPGIYRIDKESGTVATISTGAADWPVRVPNHPAFLPDGRLLYTDSGDWDAADGCIFGVEPDGRTTVVDETARRFPNGLAVAPDGRTVAVVESTLPGVSFLTIANDGSVGGRRVAVELPGTIPDGIAFDERGRMLVSCWAPDAVFLVSRDGEPTCLVADPRRFVLNQPTNIAFIPGSATVVAANIGERFLSVFEHESKGASLPRPAFRAPSREQSDHEERA